MPQSSRARQHPSWHVIFCPSTSIRNMIAVSTVMLHNGAFRFVPRTSRNPDLLFRADPSHGSCMTVSDAVQSLQAPGRFQAFKAHYRSRVCRFFQHLPTSCEWDWGLVWGHAISSDLVHWKHLPPAIRPTPGKLDADGCFSGCCTVDEAGVPTIMYTGVRLRSNQDCGPLPPSECDLQLPFIESQLIARCDKGVLQACSPVQGTVFGTRLPLHARHNRHSAQRVKRPQAPATCSLQYIYHPYHRGTWQYVEVPEATGYKAACGRWRFWCTRLPIIPI